MKLVVVRHLPTAWNAEDRLQGRQDIPIVALDELGRKRLEKQREQVCAGEPYDAIYRSTLQRTRQTAELFGYAGAVSEPLLDELNFGDFEGRLRGEMLALVGKAWLEAPQTLTFGEPVTNLAERARQFIRQNLSHERVLVFGHGAWTRALCSLHRTGSIDQMNQLTIANGEAITLAFGGDFP